jgi:hypothetical protein
MSQETADFGFKKINRYGIVSAFRNDNISIMFGRLDELLMHRPHGIDVLFETESTVRPRW